MNFSNLSPEQRVTVTMLLRGATQFIAKMNESAAATSRMAEQEAMLERALHRANRATFLQQQGMYTLRRYTFFATLGVTALAYGVFKLGLNFYNTMNTARVAFGKNGLLGSTEAANKELKNLYLVAAQSPFEFPDIVTAARRLQPFTNNIALTNQLIGDMTNSLSAAGLVTGQYLTRATLQLSHMFDVGRLTGQILLNLGRDNVPIAKALEKYYHATGLTIRKMVAGGLIDANTAAKALHQFIMTQPGFKGANFRQATGTLIGAFATLKDLLGMGAGGAEGGLFDGIRKGIAGIDKQLITLAKHNKSISLTDFFRAANAQFSSRSNLIINTWIIFSTALRTVITELIFFGKVLSLIFRPFDWLGRLFGKNGFAAKAFGYILGTLITIMILARIQTMLLAEAQLFEEIVIKRWGKAVRVLSGESGILGLVKSLKKWAFAEKVGWSEEEGRRVSMMKNNGVVARMTRNLLIQIPILYANARAWTIMNAAMLGWIGLALLIVAGLVILYFKWKPFHKLVNDTFNLITKNKYVIAAALSTIFFPIIAAMIAMRYIVNNLDKIKNLPHTVKQTVANNTQGSRNPQISGSTNPRQAFGGVWSWIKHPHLALGGTITSPGVTWVGENGPELLALPRAARVTPLDNSSVQGSIHVLVAAGNVYLDGKKVGTHLAEVTTDKEARL